MDGIFVCYHNTSEVFGFQYIPMEEMDERIFGNSVCAKQAFAMCVKVLQLALDKVTGEYAGKVCSSVLLSSRLS